MGRPRKKATVEIKEVVDECVEERSSNDTPYDAVRLKYKNYAGNIRDRFVDFTKVPFTWENITIPNLIHFVQGCNATLAPNTARYYCAMLKASLHNYEGLVNLPSRYMDVLTLKKEKSIEVYLTKKEVRMLVEYLPSCETASEQNVLKQFLIGVFTGARHSDYMHFDASNLTLVTDENGVSQYILQYVPDKVSSVKPTIPIDKENPIIEILKDIPRKDYTLDNFNEIIRAVCRKAGIKEKSKTYKAGHTAEGEKWRFVSSHTARRTFATLLALGGIPVATIGRYMGHTNPVQTMGYIYANLEASGKTITNCIYYYE